MGGQVLNDDIGNSDPHPFIKGCFLISKGVFLKGFVIMSKPSVCTSAENSG